MYGAIFWVHGSSEGFQSSTQRGYFIILPSFKGQNHEIPRLGIPLKTVRVITYRVAARG